MKVLDLRKLIPFSYMSMFFVVIAYFFSNISLIISIVAFLISIVILSLGIYIVFSEANENIEEKQNS